MKVCVDRTKCQGIGMCELTAPTIFEVGADGVSVVINENPPEQDRDLVEKAIANCPTGALYFAD